MSATSSEPGSRNCATISCSTWRSRAQASPSAASTATAKYRCWREPSVIGTPRSRGRMAISQRVSDHGITSISTGMGRRLLPPRSCPRARRSAQAGPWRAMTPDPKTRSSLEPVSIAQIVWPHCRAGLWRWASNAACAVSGGSSNGRPTHRVGMMRGVSRSYGMSHGYQDRVSRQRRQRYSPENSEPQGCDIGHPVGAVSPAGGRGNEA
jgi:hypothetical protein